MLKVILLTSQWGDQTNVIMYSKKQLTRDIEINVQMEKTLFFPKSGKKSIGPLPDRTKPSAETIVHRYQLPTVCRFV